MLDTLRAQEGIFNDSFASFFGVSCDANDEAEARIAERLPGFHIYWDASARIPALYGLTAEENGRKSMRCVTYVLDTALRVLAVIPLSDARTHAREVIETLATLPHPEPGPAGVRTGGRRPRPRQRGDAGHRRAMVVPNL